MLCTIKEEKFDSSLEDLMSYISNHRNLPGIQQKIPNEVNIQNDMMSLQCMQGTKGEISSALIFEGKKIYYSGSIAGVAEREPDFAEHLVRYMAENGATILSEHVAIPHKKDEFKLALATELGLSFEKFLQLDQNELSRRIYENDIRMVDKATHFIALVNAPSHGVGMEIQRALDKPKMGLNPTPILCLVHEEAMITLSSMIRGVSGEKDCIFLIKTYRTLFDAQQAILEFLTTAPCSFPYNRLAAT